MNIDWKLLREQKACLYHLTGSSRLSDYEKLALTGLLQLLDNLQDEAVNEGTATELEVFGEDE